jgi:hypothetical protein
MRRRLALVCRWTRDLHLYLGLFISPFVVVFSISVLLLTRARLPSGPPAVVTETRTIESPPAADDNLALARTIQERIGIAGEIDFINRNLRRNTIVFPVTRPGMRMMVRADLTTGEVRLDRRVTGAWDAVVYLHKMPGPHNVAVRGNWVLTRIWAWLADATVALLLFVTASGIYLWLMLRGELQTGLVLLAGGALSFLVCVLLVTA